MGKKISELTEKTKTEAAGGIIPVAVNGETVGVNIDEFDGSAGTVVNWASETLFTEIQEKMDRGIIPILKDENYGNPKFAALSRYGRGTYFFVLLLDNAYNVYEISEFGKACTTKEITGKTRVLENTTGGYLSELLEAGDDVTISENDGKLRISANGGSGDAGKAFWALATGDNKESSNFKLHVQRSSGGPSATILPKGNYQMHVVVAFTLDETSTALNNGIYYVRLFHKGTEYKNFIGVVPAGLSAGMTWTSDESFIQEITEDRTLGDFTAKVTKPDGSILHDTQIEVQIHSVESVGEPLGESDHKVAVSENDDTPDYLGNKIEVKGSLRKTVNENTVTIEDPSNIGLFTTPNIDAVTIQAGIIENASAQTGTDFKPGLNAHAFSVDDFIELTTNDYLGFANTNTQQQINFLMLAIYRWDKDTNKANLLCCTDNIKATASETGLHEGKIAWVNPDENYNRITPYSLNYAVFICDQGSLQVISGPKIATEINMARPYLSFKRSNIENCRSVADLTSNYLQLDLNDSSKYEKNTERHCLSIRKNLDNSEAL